MHHRTYLWLRLARELGTRTDEVARRSAVSRAYYAAYHRCLDWERQLPASGSERGRSGVHAQLIARLQHPHKACTHLQSERSRAIGQLLLEQRERRVIADYLLDKPLFKSLVTAQLAAADQVLCECDRPLHAPKNPRGRRSGRRA